MLMATRASTVMQVSPTHYSHGRGSGLARTGHPARARVTDQHGQLHQIMVEPDSADQVFQAGESILLVKLEGDIFKGFTRGDFYLPRLD